MTKCIILSSGFGLNKVLGVTFIDKFINEHKFIDKVYVVIDRKRLVEYKEKVANNVDYIYDDEIDDFGKYISYKDDLIVMKDDFVLRENINEKYMNSNYKFMDYLYIISSDENKLKFKDLELSIYEGNVYDIKQSLIKERNLKLIEMGADIQNIDFTYIDYDCYIGKNTIVYPHTYIQDKTRIGEGCTIKGNIRNSSIKNGVRIIDSYVENSIVDDRVMVGPFSYIHDDCLLKKDCVIGSYVELKKTIVGEKTKIKHQSVLLDCVIGDEVNIGAGVISANYDGDMKHISNIGNKSFIGCNSVIISPITIGNDCFIAADTTIVKDVLDNEFSISRANQVNKVRWKIKTI